MSNNCIYRKATRQGAAAKLRKHQKIYYSFANVPQKHPTIYQGQIVDFENGLFCRPVIKRKTGEVDREELSNIILWEPVNLYEYSGPVFSFDRLVADRWQGQTYAKSVKQAKANLAYQYKKQQGLESFCNIQLTGDVTKKGA